MRLLDLDNVLRTAALPVHEVAGWAARGSASWGPIRGITIHETRGSATSTDASEIGVLLNGSATAPPPIAQLYLSRTTGFHVVASGRCNHNLVGWDGPNEGYGNSQLIGIEAQHSASEDWAKKPNQYSQYVRGTAALCRAYKIPVKYVGGHKEHQPYATRPPGEGSTKSDPEFDMDKFRHDVQVVLNGEDEIVDPETIKEIGKSAADQVWFRDMDGRTAIAPAWKTQMGTFEASLRIEANLKAMAGQDWVDEEQIIDGVLTGLGTKDLDDAANALKAAFGDRTAELAAKLLATITSQ